MLQPHSKCTMTAADRKILYQYGALPFSITEEGEMRVLLVTTRGRRDWIIPKGWPIRNMTASATAARKHTKKQDWSVRSSGMTLSASTAMRSRGTPAGRRYTR